MKGAINIKFLQDGGVPLTNDLMAEIMEAISIYNILGDLAGDLTIISGCVITGSTVSDGVVYIAGDILPFQGGYISDTVIVEETESRKIFEDLADKGLIYKKVAKFGLGDPQYNWDDFVRIDDLKTIMSKLDSKASLESVTALSTLVDILSQSISTLGDSLIAHITNQSNPHGVTPAQVGIIKRGSIYIGDINGKNVGWSTSGSGYTLSLINKDTGNAAGGDDNYRITFTENLPTINFAVIVSFSASNWNNDNDLTYAISGKRLNGFDVAIREMSTNVQTVTMDYIIIKMD